MLALRAAVVTQFTLVIAPDGRAVLATRDRLSQAQREELREAVSGWADGRWPALVVEDCDVVQVAELELDLTEPVA